MNDLTLTQTGQENTCSAGLGWLATCGEGWEFLQREGREDGGMGKGGGGGGGERELFSMGRLCPDVNLEDVGIVFFCGLL